MNLQKTKKHKPFYNQFLHLRKNVQNRLKLFKFKKKKWERLQNFSKSQLRFFKRFKIHNQFGSKAIRFASRGNSFQKKFRTNLQERKVFSLFYGKLSKKYLKHKVFLAKNKSNSEFRTTEQRLVGILESRLDVVLHRANFGFSMESARHIISSNLVTVNKFPVRVSSFLLKVGDTIEIKINNKARLLVRENIDRSNFWPVPPKHLLVNYKTLQIIFVPDKIPVYSTIFNQYLSLNSIIGNIGRF